VAGPRSASALRLCVSLTSSDAGEVKPEGGAGHHVVLLDPHFAALMLAGQGQRTYLALDGAPHAAAPGGKLHSVADDVARGRGVTHAVLIGDAVAHPPPLRAAHGVTGRHVGGAPLTFAA